MSHVPINPFAGDLESLSSPRTGEKCMICGRAEPASLARVRHGDNLHWGIICASHTVRQVVLSGLIDVDLRVGERLLAKPSIPVRGAVKNNPDGSRTIVAPRRGQTPARRDPSTPLPDPCS